MKKKIFFTFKILFALFVIYIIINQFDSKRVKSEFFGKSAEDIFGKPDYSKKNGYYRLFTLDEPEDIDIESEEVYIKYRNFLDPEFNNEKIKIDKNWRKNDVILKLNNFKTENKKSFKWFDKRMKYSTNWCKKILMNKDEIKRLKTIFKVYMIRYSKLIENEKLEDISNIELHFNDLNGNTNGSIPSLIVWSKLGTIYNSINALDSLEGNWERGTNKLISHIFFLRKIIKTNKLIMTNIISKDVLRDTILTINNLLNDKNCPKTISKLILNIPDIEYEEYGNSRSFITEAVFGNLGEIFYKTIENEKYNNEISFPFSLLYQKNKSFNFYDQHIKNLLEFDKTHPYSWKKDLKNMQSSKNGFFWWLQNPIGKVTWDIILSISWPGFKRSIIRSLEIKAIFDMLKISAELRLAFNGEKSIKDLLKTLKTYNSLNDLCSGKPYKWNKKKEILYSIGIDREDNNGVYSKSKVYFQAENIKDYPLPVILYIK